MAEVTSGHNPIIGFRNKRILYYFSWRNELIPKNLVTLVMRGSMNQRYIERKENMVNTKEYRTKTLYNPQNNIRMEGIWGIALDIGYSAVKVFSSNVAACFPSYAKKIKDNFLNLGSESKTQILYKDMAGGSLWMVGDMAQEIADIGQDSETELYGRNRYFSEMFLVIARTGLALGMEKNQFGDPNGKKLIIQTGLPPKYLENDTPLLKEALSGTHHFQLKVGDRKWKEYKFSLSEKDIFVIPQPMGTLFSIAIKRDGRKVLEAGQYFKSNLVILDIGFGTLDTFYIRNGMIDSYETFEEYGMKEVFLRTGRKIFDTYHTEIRIPSMQKYLKTGKIRVMNRKERITKNVPFSDLLEISSREVCNEALEKICSIYNSLMDCDYLVITGGTADAWKKDIINFFSGMETLKIIPGNLNDDLPYIFNNVRGYYMYLYNVLKAKSRNKC